MVVAGIRRIFALPARRQYGVIGQIVLVSVALVLTWCPRARAAADPGWFEGHSAADQQAITDLAYRGSPLANATSASGLPYTDSGSLDRSAELAQAERSLTAGGVDDAINTGLRSARIAGKLMPALSAFGDVSLVGHTFILGWEIGTGLNAKFLHIGVDAIGLDPVGVVTSGRWD